jgi:hypothetical protein
MVKLKLVADPTFQAAVPIPIAGGKPVPVVFTFKHRTRAALDEWMKVMEGKSNLEYIMGMAEAWELEDAFTKENVELLLQNRLGAADAISFTYHNELYPAKLGNSAR